MEPIKRYIKNNKRKTAMLLTLLFCFIVFLIFVKHNYFLYQATIVKVLQVSETEVHEFNKNQPIYQQTVEAIVMNGENKGDVIEFENKRIYSALTGYGLRAGDDLFVNLNNDGTLRSIDGVKRDFLVALLLSIFCFSLIAIDSRRSHFILVSSFINIAIFILILFLRTKFYNIFLLFIIATVLFTAITLFIIGGFNRKTAAAILSTLISVAIMMTIAIITFKIFKDSFYYETMEFLSYMYDYKWVFYSGVLISGLGAIMDNTIIISTAINELISKNPAISTKELKHSAWEIAQDISGTMMNVLFFSCIIGALPSIILTFSNGMPLFFVIEYFGSAEIIRALVGCIGIVLAVPISYFVNMSLRRKAAS